MGPGQPPDNEKPDGLRNVGGSARPFIVSGQSNPPRALSSTDHENLLALLDNPAKFGIKKILAALNYLLSEHGTGDRCGQIQLRQSSWEDIGPPNWRAQYTLSLSFDAFSGQELVSAGVRRRSIRPEDSNRILTPHDLIHAPKTDLLLFSPGDELSDSPQVPQGITQRTSRNISLSIPPNSCLRLSKEILSQSLIEISDPTESAVSYGMRSLHWIGSWHSIRADLRKPGETVLIVETCRSGTICAGGKSG